MLALHGQNSIAALTRIMEQALRDGIIDRNPARVTGWQREYQRAEDELDDPRSLALADWEALERLAAALVARSYGHYQGWGDAVAAAACTAARIRGRSPVSGRKTLTGRDGSGLCVGRPPRALVASSTKAPKGSGPARFR